MFDRRRASERTVPWLSILLLAFAPGPVIADTPFAEEANRRSFVEAAQTDNQAVLAATFDSIWPQVAQVSGFRQVGELLADSDHGGLRVSLDTLSGELHGTLQAYAATAALNQQRYLLAQRNSERRRAALHRSVPDEYPNQSSDNLPGSVWLNVYREWSLLGNDGNAGQLDATGPGIMLGLERGGINSFWGLALQGYSTEDINVGEHEERTLPTDSGSLESQGFYAYGGTARGDYEFDGSIGYLQHRMDSHRQLYYNAPLRQATADYTADQINLTLGMGKSIYGEQFVVQPHLALSYSRFSRQAFREAGAGDLGLTLDGTNFDVLEGRASLNITLVRSSSAITVTPELNLGVSYAFLEEDERYSAAFIAAPDTVFSAAGLPRGQLRTDIATGLIADLSDNWRGRFEYQGRFTSREETHSVFVGVRRFW